MCVVVSLCQSAGGGRGVCEGRGSCPVLKVAPIGRKVRVVVMMMMMMMIRVNMRMMKVMMMMRVKMMMKGSQ